MQEGAVGRWEGERNRMEELWRKKASRRGRSRRKEGGRMSKKGVEGRRKELL
jgi:hypothetical protein